MSTTSTLLLILVLAGLLVAYIGGHRAGVREGFQKGVEDGKRQRAAQAYAVGYDRGKREASETKPAPEKPAKRHGWTPVLLFLGLLLILIVGQSWGLSAFRLGSQ